MRAVISQKEVRVFYRNRYGKIEHIEHIMPQTPSFIPTSDKRIRAFLENKKEIFIYEGEGELPLEEALKPYDFKGLDIKILDFYLQEGHYPFKTRHKQKRLIDDFVSVYEQNNTLSYTIIPPFYEDILESLFFDRKRGAR